MLRQWVFNLKGKRVANETGTDLTRVKASVIAKLKAKDPNIDLSELKAVFIRKIK